MGYPVLLLETARTFLTDPAYPVPERVKRWRAFLREVSVEKERLLRLHFLRLNGFDATDNAAKRQIIDDVAWKMTGCLPKSDQERDALTDTPHPMRPLMWIGWRPLFLSEPAAAPSSAAPSSAAPTQLTATASITASTSTTPPIPRHGRGRSAAARRRRANKKSV